VPGTPDPFSAPGPPCPLGEIELRPFVADLEELALQNVDIAAHQVQRLGAFGGNRHAESGFGGMQAQAHTAKLLGAEAELDRAARDARAALCGLGDAKRDLTRDVMCRCTRCNGRCRGGGLQRGSAQIGRGQSRIAKSCPVGCGPRNGGERQGGRGRRRRSEDEGRNGRRCRTCLHRARRVRERSPGIRTGEGDVCFANEWHISCGFPRRGAGLRRKQGSSLHRRHSHRGERLRRQRRMPRQCLGLCGNGGLRLRRERLTGRARRARTGQKGLYGRRL